MWPWASSICFLRFNSLVSRKGMLLVSTQQGYGWE